MSTLGTEFIGKGWKFPIKVDARGRLSWSEGTERLEDAIWLVVRTSLGERVMRPTFGAGANDYVFQPNSPPVRAELTSAIRSALLNWEPRVDLDTVAVDPVAGDPSRVLVTIAYRVRTTNELFNVVYPFYLGEGVG
jgi:phage baseplate assembly protein W